MGRWPDVGVGRWAWAWAEAGRRGRLRHSSLARGVRPDRRRRRAGDAVESADDVIDDDLAAVVSAFTSVTISL